MGQPKKRCLLILCQGVPEVWGPGKRQVPGYNWSLLLARNLQNTVVHTLDELVRVVCNSYDSTCKFLLA